MEEKKPNLRESQELIRISKATKDKIRLICKETKYAEVTVLEYLLNGNIELNRLRD